MDISDLSKIVGRSSDTQYEDRIQQLKKDGKDTSSIEHTVTQTIENIRKKSTRSFVIFGEPQSGKTEMMISLNNKLLDCNYRIIVNLLTDSIDLLDQSLERFRSSGMNPSPKNFSELPDNPARLQGQQWVVFCKKNARDLEKLIEILRFESSLIVIDDEADYASPDGNINKPDHDKTKINSLIFKLMGDTGIYIGVTATPARLNLNNTFDNESEKWVDFKPHPYYVGQEFFFPENGKCDYRLHAFEGEEGDEKLEIEKAILNFLCGVAELHILGKEKNYTMLVHTSGKQVEHVEDFQLIENVLASLSNPRSGKFKSLFSKLEKIAPAYGEKKEICEFVLRNIRKNMLVEINSRDPRAGKVADIAKPSSLFSFGVGGNIISRGVTFDNLLSMYFTRSVKGKFAQDTYIQRARMFGDRENYKNHFQLWIPEELMGNWSRCFRFHKLALVALRSDWGTPVWISDHKTTPTSATSIDKSSVDFDGGEMSFGLFDYADESIKELFNRNCRNDKEVLDRIAQVLDGKYFPPYIKRYLEQELINNKLGLISFHKPSGFGTASSNYTDEEKENIRRSKGIFATSEYKRSEFPDARHHLKVFYNDYGKARLFYKIKGSSIKFIQNRK